MARRRETREEKKARTRSDLIAAARRVFGRRGFHEASLEEIAETAGLTTGAVYSNFTGKEDLFLAVYEEHVVQRLDSTERALATAEGPEDRARAGADEWMRFLDENREWYPLFIEFWSWAVRRPELRERLAAQYGRFCEANTIHLVEGARALGIELPPELSAPVGIIITALADGLALMRLLDPEAVPASFYGDTLAMMLRPEWAEAPS